MPQAVRPKNKATAIAARLLWPGKRSKKKRNRYKTDSL
jgi:hypothetical protein